MEGLLTGAFMPSSLAPSSLITSTDIDVGCRLYDALAKHAASTVGAPVTYEDLLTLARNLYTKDAVLGRAVPVGIGPKLHFIEGFCTANGGPNLACLPVNKLTMRPGHGYTGDWDAERQAVARFDWAGMREKLAGYAEQRKGDVPARFKPRKERPADVAWYAYFCSHREACAKVTGDDKKEIINLLMAGLDPETALRQVLAAKDEMGSAA
jgi:hypothetical protein